MGMHNPPHPGGVVKRQCLESPGLTVTRAAEGLGVTRQALSELINERTGISVDMAIRLSKGFGSTPETRLGMQTAWDLWQARDPAEEIAVEKFAAARARDPRRTGGRRASRGTLCETRAGVVSPQRQPGGGVSDCLFMQLAGCVAAPGQGRKRRDV